MKVRRIRCFIGIGTNMGDREKNIRIALSLLMETGIYVENISTIEQTAPVEMIDQPVFLNCIVEAYTTREPDNLLRVLLDIENRMGRVRTISKGPRLIDLDILLFGDQIISQADLVIPHPAIHNRQFVLRHLVELDDSLVCPQSGIPYKEISYE